MHHKMIRKWARSWFFTSNFSLLKLYDQKWNKPLHLIISYLGIKVIFKIFAYSSFPKCFSILFDIQIFLLKPESIFSSLMIFLFKLLPIQPSLNLFSQWLRMRFQGILLPTYSTFMILCSFSRLSFIFSDEHCISFWLRVKCQNIL